MPASSAWHTARSCPGGTPIAMHACRVVNVKPARVGGCPVVSKVYDEI